MTDEEKQRKAVVEKAKAQGIPLKALWHSITLMNIQ